jgi:hypothetical protein
MDVGHYAAERTALEIYLRLQKPGDATVVGWSGIDRTELFQLANTTTVAVMADTWVTTYGNRHKDKPLFVETTRLLTTLMGLFRDAYVSQAIAAGMYHRHSPSDPAKVALQLFFSHTVASARARLDSLIALIQAVLARAPRAR